MDNHPLSVPRDHVLGVLRLHGVDITVDGSIYILVYGDMVEAQALPEQVTRHLLGRFASKFGFSMADFFAPRHVSDPPGNPPAEQHPKP